MDAMSFGRERVMELESYYSCMIIFTLLSSTLLVNKKPADMV